MVAVLMTDLEGSTAMAQRLGPAAAEALRLEHFALLRGAIERTGGREVKSRGDGLMIVFDGAGPSLACATQIQQAVDARNRRAEEKLGVRIGVSLGDTTFEDGDYYGDAVVEAARLCDGASGGQIVVTDVVYRLARSRDGHAFEPLGGLELKGFAEPVKAFELCWEPAPVTGIVLPERLRREPATVFVGREAERERMAELWRQACAGSLRVALLSGEPGMGKTRLATHLAYEVRVEGSTVLYGHCDEDLGIPYQPWVQALSHLVKEAPDAVLHGHVERVGSDLARLIPSLRDRLPELPAPRESDQETERYLMYAAVAALLEEAGAHEPVLLILDDLHWADAPTLSLLRHAVDAASTMNVMVVGAFRDSELSQDHPLTSVLAALHREQGVQRIKLSGLDPEDVQALMEAAAGQELDEEGRALAAEITRETAGNPFFTEEMLRHLVESEAVVQGEDGRWRLTGNLVDLGLPQSVRDVVGQRVERLGADAGETLTTAAVIGRDFDVALLTELVEIPESLLLDQLEAAVGATLLHESPDQVGQFTFEHALVNHTLYQGLGATRRARLHHRVALALESLYGTDAEEHLADLATHWRLASVAIDTAKAAGYSIRAGWHALDSLAPTEAAKLFSGALELLGPQDTAERCEALIGLGTAQRQTGNAAYRETLLEASRIACDLQDTELTARAVLANNRGFYSALGQVDDERLAAIERALELDEPPHPARRARLLALQALELTHDPNLERRQTLVEEALATARGAGDRRALAEVLRSAFFALWSAKTLGLRSALAEELAGLADELADPGLRRATHNIELHVSVERGELAQAQAALERMQEIAAELGQPQVNWAVAFQTAALKLLRGELAAGERLVERAFQLGQEAEQPDAVLFYGVQMIYLRTYQGRGEEIIAMLEQAVQANPAVPALRAGLASGLCWLDRRAEAAVILKRAAADRFEHVLPASDELTALHLYADAAAQTCDRPVAAILYERMQPSADQLAWNGLSGYGHDQLFLGLLAATLGEHEQANKHLAFACEFHETNDMPLWTARSHLGWAEALAARGDPAGAREHATRALELSQAHGYGAFEPRAATLLAAQAAAQA